MFPLVELSCRLLAKDVRKLLSETVPVLLPSAATSLSKLVCNELSAALVVLSPLVDPLGCADRD
jgi:hypothetical protein